jgi:hypothetical protein
MEAFDWTAAQQQSTTTSPSTNTCIIIIIDSPTQNTSKSLQNSPPFEA